MMRLRHKLLINAFRVFDQVLLVGVLTVLIAVITEKGSFRYVNELLGETYGYREIFGILMLLSGWVAIFNTFVHYDANRFTTLASSIAALMKATTVSTFVLFLVGASLQVSKLPNTVILFFWIVTSFLGIASRLVLRSLLMSMRRSGFNCRHVVFVGNSERAIAMAKRIEARPELGYRIAGFISEKEDAVIGQLVGGDRWPVLGTISQIKSFLEKRPVDEIMICLSIKDEFKKVYEVFQLCRELGIVVRVMPPETDINVLSRLQVELFEGECVVTFFRENLIWQLLAKRIMDVLVSGLLLIVLFPFLLVIAVLIKLTSPGPVFFVQERVGMNKRKFKLLKFRSMGVDAEKRKQELMALNEMEGPAFKMRNDPRVTSIGKFLRKTSTDELPQLINVIKGEMSLVGPRPPLASEVDQYEWLHRRRLSIKPGITCLWQISGRNNIPFVKWMEMDQEYVENWSIWLDVKILAKTVPAVLFGRGAS